ncbi:MAG: S46 family peptidase [Bacteroidota bacterium]
MRKGLHYSLLKLLFAAVLLLPIAPARADEGMWLPIYLKILNEQAMQDLGMKLTTDQVYSINKASMKDAVVQFGGGCTGAIVSPEGLLFTNHHCGFSYIQRHSSVENNYIDKGFWAKTHADELPNTGLTVSILVRMEDVTQRILENIPTGASEKEREAAIAYNIEKVKKEAVAGTHYSAFIRPFFYGAEFYLFVNEVFKDVRLVGAPPASIGDFGGDDDNWMWPRHNADFSMFRIYAGPDNKPAAYSKENVPYRPRQHFHISLDGVNENDFTMVLGYPGRTQEYLSSWAINMIEKESNIYKIALRDKRLKVLRETMNESDSMKIRFAARFASVANARKKWAGESAGLEKANAAAKKAVQEAAFAKWADADPKRQKEYGRVLPALKKAYDTLNRIILPVEYQSEAVYGNDILPFVSTYGAMAELCRKGRPDPKAVEALRAQTTAYFRNSYLPMDKKMFALCMTSIHKDVRPEYRSVALTGYAGRFEGDFNKMTDWLFKHSAFTDKRKTEKILNSLEKGSTEKLEKDPLYKLWFEFNRNYEIRLQPTFNNLRNTIESNSMLFVDGLRKMYPERNFYPDANSTFRVAYGKVGSYSPTDGKTYLYSTTLDGVMQKEDSNSLYYKVPARLKELYRRRDFGIYAIGKMPVAFIATNHTTGGNSGSPVTDANGRLIGLNFDRVWEGTMSDVNYDASVCRNISLDMRYALFIVDKYAGASHLIKEMTLIRNGKPYFYLQQ